MTRECLSCQDDECNGGTSKILLCSLTLGWRRRKGAAVLTCLAGVPFAQTAKDARELAAICSKPSGISLW